MTKEFYKKCILSEVYQGNSKLRFYVRFWRKHFKPETNAVYLIRRFQFYSTGGALHKLYAKLISILLMRRYNIFIAGECEIDVGLSIRHPSGIFITNASIGQNFTVYQNCTIGRKTKDTPTGRGYIKLGDNVTMYAGSIIIGDYPIVDDVTIGAGACLFNGADEPGIYVGNPARRLR